MVSKKQPTTPYVPPITKKLEERGGGPSTPASSLLHRMGVREVDDDVIAVVAWTLSHFQPKPDTGALWEIPDVRARNNMGRSGLMKRIERELLDDLGLEWFEEPMGGLVLQPKEEYRVSKPTKRKPQEVNLEDLLKKHGGWHDAERYYFPSVTARDAWYAEMKAAQHHDNAEFVLSKTVIKRGGKAPRKA